MTNLSIGPGGANRAAPEPNDQQNAALLQAFIKQMISLGKFGRTNLFGGSATTTKSNSQTQESEVKEAVKDDIIKQATTESVVNEDQFDSMVQEWVKSLSSTPPAASKPGMAPPLSAGTAPQGPNGTGNPWAKMPYASILMSIIMNCMQIDAQTQFMSTKRQSQLTLAQGQAQRDMAQLKIEIGEQEKREYTMNAALTLAQGCAGLALGVGSVYLPTKMSNAKYQKETNLVQDNSKANVKTYMETKAKTAESDQALMNKKSELSRLEKNIEGKSPGEIEKQKTALTEKLNKTDGDLEAKNAELNRQKVTNANIKADREAAQANLKDKDANVENFTNNRATINKEQAENDTKLNQAEKDLAAAKANRDATNANPNATAAQKREAEDNVNIKEQEVKRLTDEKAVLQARSAQNETNLTNAKNQQATAKQAADIQEGRFQEAQKNTESLKSEIKGLQSQRDTQEKDIKNLDSSGTQKIKELKEEIKGDEKVNSSLHKDLEKMGTPGVQQLREHEDEVRASGKADPHKDEVAALKASRENELKERETNPAYSQHVKNSYYQNYTYAFQLLNGAVEKILESTKNFIIGDIKLEKAQLESYYILTEATAKLFDNAGESMRNDVQTAGKNLDGWASFAQQILQSETDRFGFKR
jgi:hypothetical protein